MNKKFSINTGLTLILFGSSKLIQLVSNLILTRILMPEAFGLMAIVNVVIVGLDMISDFGIRTAIIQNKNADQHSFVMTAWTLQLVRGAVLSIAALLIAFPLATLYDNPLLFPMLCLAALSPLFRGFQSIGFEYAFRNQNLGRVTFLDLFTQFIAFILTIVLALNLQSVWALAIGAVLQPAIRAALSHIYLPSQFKIGFDRGHLSSIFNFGKWVFASTLLTYVAGKGVIALQGVFVDIETLAFISIASTFAWLVGDLVVRLSGQVFFPYLAETIRSNPSEFNNQLVKVRLLILTTSVPAFCFVSFVGAHVIEFLYDDRYLEAGKYLVLLALNGAIAMFITPYPNAFLALGHSKIRFYLMLVSSVLTVIGLLIGYGYGGVIGMIIGMGVGSTCASATIIFMAAKHGMSTPKVDAVFFLLFLVLAYASIVFNRSVF